MIIGILASTIAGLATFVGALPVLFIKNPNQRVIAVMLGFGGGVMLAASSFSLIIPGTDAAIFLGYSKYIAAFYHGNYNS
jgi:ZIP family zinc transporter